MCQPTIGFPKALLYHKYYNGWKVFFEELDCKVVESNSSTKDIFDRGNKIAEEEACLPVKLFLGHVEFLKDKVDYIFVPRVVSIEKNEFLCPKFLGLPEMVKSSIKDLPKLIDKTINLRNSKVNFIKAVFAITQQLDRSYYQGLKAMLKALITFNNHSNYLVQQKNEQAEYKVGILGHEYIVYDDYISGGIIDKLKEMGVRAVTTEMLTKRELNAGIVESSQDMFWTFSKRMLGTAHHFFNSQDIDGIIQLTAFGCGPDSLVGEMISRKSKDKTDLPFMTLNLDEHTGEAGLITRIEAFIDMIRWRGELK
jgi:predicted nucleotide-binding protein (sugar kinase/HSP70/actin superfamily)